MSIWRVVIVPIRGVRVSQTLWEILVIGLTRTCYETDTLVTAARSVDDGYNGAYVK
jgi:hypothetical protein